MPDLTVAGKAADHFARRDVVLDAALGFTAQARTRTAPAGRHGRPPARWKSARAGYELLRSWVLPKLSSFEPSRWLS